MSDMVVGRITQLTGASESIKALEELAKRNAACKSCPLLKAKRRRRKRERVKA